MSISSWIVSFSHQIMTDQWLFFKVIFLPMTKTMTFKIIQVVFVDMTSNLTWLMTYVLEKLTIIISSNIESRYDKYLCRSFLKLHRSRYDLIIWYVIWLHPSPLIQILQFTISDLIALSHDHLLYNRNFHLLVVCLRNIQYFFMLWLLIDRYNVHNILLFWIIE